MPVTGNPPEFSFPAGTWHGTGASLLHQQILFFVVQYPARFQKEETSLRAHVTNSENWLQLLSFFFKVDWYSMYTEIPAIKQMIHHTNQLQTEADGGRKWPSTLYFYPLHYALKSQYNTYNQTADPFAVSTHLQKLLASPFLCLYCTFKSHLQTQVRNICRSVSRF